MAYDAVNKRHYQAGKPYRATGAYENRLFESMVEKGRADIYVPEAKKETKVAPPKETKVRKVRKPRKTKK